MPVIYMMPFGLISAAAGLVCLIVPRWRRDVFAAVVSPIAFGGCSIVTLVTVVLLSDHLGISAALGLDRSLGASWRAIAVVAITYVVSGISGAVIAASIANRVQRWRFG